MKFWLFPALRKFQHAGANAARSMYKDGVSQKKRHQPTALVYHFQSAIGPDGAHLIADFILMGYYDDSRAFSARRPMQDEVPMIVGLRFCPRRQQPGHSLAHAHLVIAYAVGFDKIPQNSLRRRGKRRPSRQSRLGQG